MAPSSTPAGIDRNWDDDGDDQGAPTHQSNSRMTQSYSSLTSPTVTPRPSRRNLSRLLSFDGTTRYNSLPRFLTRSHHRRRHLSGEGGAGGATVEASQRDQFSYDDADFQSESQAAAGNGVRVWYESYTTIDWIHDAIKESSRLRRLRTVKGFRGILVNLWDRLQGWLIVTVTGLITACIAAGIVKLEALLFDLKEGYCARDWRLAKRFCCPFGDQPDWDNGGPIGLAQQVNASMSISSSPIWMKPYHTSFLSTSSSTASDPSKGLLTGMGNRLLAGWAAPVASSPMWTAQEAEFSCPGWVTWADKFKLHGRWNGLAEYGIYIAIAIVLASIACLLTIYLTSSDLYQTDAASDQVSANASKNGQATTSQSSQGDATNGHIPDERTPLLSQQDVVRSPDNGHGQAENGVTSAASHRLPTKLSKVSGDVRAQAALPARKVLYFGSGSGISEIKCILGGFVIHGYLGFWTLFTKSIGLALSVASGLSLGKEGPFVHIASCVGNIVCRVFPKYERNESKRREVLSCACAAGVAVAFGAPVGGVLFSLEEVSYYFPAKVMFRSFFCAMVAAATLRLLDPFGTGKIVLFQVTYDRDWNWVELAFFVLLGIFGGVYGALFTKLNMFWSKNVRSKTWMAKHPLYEVMMITAITVAISFLNGYTRMGGPELIANLFSECHEHESLEGLCVSQPSQIGPLVSAVAWTMLVKGLLTIVTFGIKLPAGIFIPTLCVGACFGRIVGLLVQYAQWTHPHAPIFAWCQANGESDSACIVPGVYAMIGAAAALSGVTRTTISLVVIMFELTGTLTYSVPVMLGVLVARTIADGLERKGIYDLVLEFSGLPYLDAKEEHTWQGVSIADTVDTGAEVISLDVRNTVASLRAKLERLALVVGNPDGGFPIVVSDGDKADANEQQQQGLPNVRSRNGKQRLIGYIAAQELEHGLNRIDLNNARTGVDSAEVVCTFDFLPRLDGRGVKTSRGTATPTASVDRRNDDTEQEEDEGQDDERFGESSSLLNEGAFMQDSTLMDRASRLSTNDLSIFVDRAPITLAASSPLELVHQMFVKLGVRYLVIVHPNGTYKGVIFKKRWLAFLHSFE